MLGGTSRLYASQIFVFHFPGMIERVKGGVPYQVPQRPLAGQFTLRVVVPDCVAIGIAMRLQPLARQHRTVGGVHAKQQFPELG